MANRDLPYITLLSTLFYHKKFPRQIFRDKKSPKTVVLGQKLALYHPSSARSGAGDREFQGTAITALPREAEP